MALPKNRRISAFFSLIITVFGKLNIRFHSKFYRRYHKVVSKILKFAIFSLDNPALHILLKAEKGGGRFIIGGIASI
jgi:hypothetical protein